MKVYSLCGCNVSEQSCSRRTGSGSDRIILVPVQFNECVAVQVVDLLSYLTQCWFCTGSCGVVCSETSADSSSF